MKEIIGKCGTNCSICPWSKVIKENLTEEEYQKYKVKCKDVLHFAPTGPFQNCVNCQTPEKDWPQGARIPLRNCLIRRCVMFTGIDNCAYCSRYPCGYIKRTGNEWSKETLEKKYQKEISLEDAKIFVEPFERIKHLDKIRSTLKSQEIKEVKTIPIKKKEVTPFPEKILVNGNDIKYYKKIHLLIEKINNSSLGLEDIDTFAQSEKLKERVVHFLRFLWIFGNYGILVKNDIGMLKVTADKFISNRGTETHLGTWQFIEDNILKTLPNFGLLCHFTSLTQEKKNWLTPTGALKNTGWEMHLTPKDEHDKNDLLIVLTNYCSKLTKKFEKKAFSYFIKTDMKVLI